MRFKFCKQLQNSIFFSANDIFHCCSCEEEQAPIYKSFFGEKVDWSDFISTKLKYQKEALETGKIPFPVCEKCHLWLEDEYDDGGYVNEIVVSHWTNCNCNCFYCFTAENKPFYNSEKPYKLMPLLKDMEKSGILKFDGMVRFLGGDVALIDELEDFINFFIERGCKNIYIPTSGIKFLPIVEKVLEKGIGEVIVSPDAGTPELYKKIKRVDCYNIVKENMKKYAEAAKKGGSIFRSKYILIPYVNDTKEDIDKWISECKEIGIENIGYDVEGNFISKFGNEIPEKIPQLLEYIEEKINENGIKSIRFKFASQMLYEIKQGTKKITKSKENIEEQKRYMDMLLTR